MNQHLRPEPVAFIDIGAQRRRLGAKIDEAVARVLTHCQFINGPEVTQLEADLAAFCGAKHVVACASGTDALLMVLMAQGIGPGDAVICPSFTFCATGEVVALPLFVDVDETTFNMNIASLKKGIATGRKLGLKVKAVIPVDLFGQPADHDAIAEVAKSEGLFVLDDAAQSFGATYKGKRLGTFGLATATSFFPAKPLGCFGDGGAIFTDDADLAERLRSVRVHGQGTEKYDNVRLGLTGRLDTMQAAILIEKLKIFQDEIDARDNVAGRHPPAERRARGVRQCAQGAGHSDRDLLPEVDAPADGLQALSGGRGRIAGQRKVVGGRHQPADARLSRTGDAGSRHQGRARRAGVRLANNWRMLSFVIARSTCDEAIQSCYSDRWIASLRSQ